ncbi:hypothetical protein DUI87_33403 [Hirundo rustica rustica]|uniref:Uncharacterized protein n=2 Tax=Hirundo rustica TaxID=43150 RepID=A0A3M0J6I1_HIRRU|nr:hypothetical protein DUI87_33403 [Hirundo rustica rustica]
MEPRSPPRSPGAPQPACPRPLQAPHDLHAPGRGEENVFSHLPLHSQQLARTPYPMIPIGGIQMVQARPSSHASLVPGPVLPLQAGHLASAAGRAARRDGEPQSPPEPSSESVSPVAKVSKYALSPETTAGGFSEEKMRTSELRPEQEEHRPAAEAEPGPAQQPGPSVSPSSPSTPQEPSPEPSASGEEPSKATGEQQSGSSSTPSEPACTFISAVPSLARDSPSEAPPGQAQPCSLRPRNLSGSSPHPEHSDLGQTHEKVDENAGST